MTAHTAAVARRTGPRCRRTGPRCRRTGPRCRGAALYAGLALLFVFAPAAQDWPVGSVASAERCSPGWVCGWTGPSYTGVVSLAAQDMPYYPETTAYVGFNNAASVWNGAGTSRVGGEPRGRCVTVYNGTAYKGRALTIAPGQGIAQLPASFGHIHSSRFHPCRLP
ncbi:peptidase inhibitor family I36 protein [Streptomyces echinatus]|nr:peptidase inhibitor family I36 protein [Streptomyces echinatus]